MKCKYCGNPLFDIEVFAPKSVDETTSDTFSVIGLSLHGDMIIVNDDKFCGADCWIQFMVKKDEV